MNTFKIGDKITVNPKELGNVELRDCTADTEYTLTLVGTWAEDTTRNEPTAVSFMDDRGDAVTINYSRITLAKEL